MAQLDYRVLKNIIKALSFLDKAAKLSKEIIKQKKLVKGQKPKKRNRRKIKK